MRPKQPEAEPRDDLFRARLENLVDPRHALARLAGLIDWGRFEAEFGALYTDGGRPGLPTRLMVGLHLLKHMDGLSDGEGGPWPTFELGKRATRRGRVIPVRVQTTPNGRLSQ